MKRSLLMVAFAMTAPLFGAGAAFEAIAASASTATPNFHVAREIALPGDEFWDYLTVDSAGGRLFVAHGDRVQVVDTRTGVLSGEIDHTPGVHGVALADDLGRGYISVGRSDLIVVFDLRSLTRLAEIPTSGANPDAILYDRHSHKVFSFNGRGRNITVLDTTTNKVVATLAVDAKPEFAVSDLAGHAYVNLEDRNSIAVIDTTKLVVEKTWPLSGCTEPTGLAIDREHGRLFSVCSNATMAVVDTANGRQVARLPIGARVDGVAYDAGLGLAFASCGDGTMSIVREESPLKFSVAQTVVTRAGARTVAVDEATHQVYTATSKFMATPGQRPRIEPGTFVVMAVAK